MIKINYNTLINALILTIAYLLYKKLDSSTSLIESLIELKAINFSNLFEVISFIFIVILVITILAFVETLIFQYGVITLLKHIKFFKEKNIIIAIISVLLYSFGTHYIYFRANFFTGLLSAYAYLIYKEKADSPFKTVFLTNFIKYTFAFIFSLSYVLV